MYNCIQSDHMYSFIHTQSLYLVHIPLHCSKAGILYFVDKCLNTYIYIYNRTSINNGNVFATLKEEV